MIAPDFFGKLLAQHGTDFFAGVPDSLLKSFCAWIGDYTGEQNHIIAVNEGAAVALAAGYHLAMGKIPLVYMQNSGIGNAVNPLLSLVDGDVYRIPLVLLVGWRGEPGVPDEPQHLKQGKVTCALFEAIGIPYRILPNTENEVAACIKECYAHIAAEGTPFALIARKGTFAPYQSVSRDSGAEQDRMAREQAIEEIIRACSCGDIFVSTTGMASRELYELREKFGAGHARDFLTVGSMGHASSLALALALQKPRLPVNCIDGDGAALMHLGALAAIGARKPANLRYFLLNNGAHDSVGGQPTIAPAIDFTGIARSAGFRRVYAADTPEELRRALRETAGEGGPVFIEIKVRKGSRAGLGRPRSSPGENKEAFMRFVAEERND